MRRRTMIAAAAVPLAATVLACGVGDGDTEGPGTDSGTGKHTIVLEVTGPAAADITYSTGADQSQDNGTKLPWRKEITADRVPFAISVVAQSKGQTGEIVCRITVDAAVKKENKSAGQFAVVTCTS